MKNLFPGHYKPSEKEFQKLWNECIFVFDTNILLNVYRYSEKTRERLFEILDLLQARIWLPYQVAYEYQEERLNVISHQLKPYEEIEKVLNENLARLNSAIEPYRKRHSFTSLVDDKKFIDTTKRANKRILKSLEETKSQYPNLIENDIYREKIGDLFEDKIGSPHDEDKLKEVHTQCKSRFEKNIPPGYKDKNKSVDQKQYGDAILWLQIIEYAKTENKPIIFVTDDNKDDWWKRHQGQTISPRTELIEEMKNEANVDFWMYTGDRFLRYAEDYLKLNEQPETIEEAEEVRLEGEDISPTTENNSRLSTESDTASILRNLSSQQINSFKGVDKVLENYRFNTKELEKVMMPRINLKNQIAIKKLIDQQLNPFTELSKEMSKIVESYKFNAKELKNIMTPQINLRDIVDNVNRLNEYSSNEEE